MAGQRHTMDGIGAGYESAVQSLLTPYASLVPVPRPDDFGIDFYCHLRKSTGPHTETVTDLAALQVKGGEAVLTYGGNDPHGDWKKHEMAWLMSLSAPLYLVKITRDRRVVDVFSLGPVWHRFMAQGVYPFEIICTTQPPSSNIAWRLAEPTYAEVSNRGDGRRWTVDLGAPIVRVSVDDVEDNAHRDRIVAVLRRWIANDRQNLMRFLQGVPVFTGFTGWQTNAVDAVSKTIAQHWSTTPGKNITPLCQTASPLLVNLGIHLQWQNDRAAYALIPVLEWLNERQQLDRIGQGLLAGLVEKQHNGVGPKD